MKIDKLVLKNYKRLMLSNIRHFEWSPKSSIMLLLGSNGSGKSSLMEELTPCPAHHTQFEKTGGLKEFHCTHGNHSYILISTYNGGSGSHSFIRDLEEELNPGGTFAVQKELVAKIFGLDRGIHDILTGVTTFSSMPTAKRREWLTRLSPIDLSFAFTQYNTIKNHMSDARGVINHKAKRMANENIDLPSDGELTQYREQIAELTDRLQSLYRQRGSDPIKSSNIVDFGARYETLRKKTIRHLQTQPNNPVLFGIASKSDMEIRIHSAAQKAQHAKSQLEDIAHELDEIQRQTIPESDLGTPEKIHALEAELHKCKTEKHAVDKYLTTYTSDIPLVKHEVFPHSKGLLDEMMASWIPLIHEFPDNLNDQFSHEKGTSTRLRFAENKTRLQALTERHSASTQRFARMRGCDDVVCPDCSHSFKPGIHPEDLRLAEVACKELAEQIEQIEGEQKWMGEYIEAYDDYLSFVNRFRGLVRQYEVYKPMWEHVVGRRMMFTEPRKHLTAIIAWHEAQTRYIAAAGLEQHILQIEEQLQRYASMDLSHTEYLRKRQETLELKISHLGHVQVESANEARYLRNVVGQVDSYGAATVSIQREFDEYMSAIGQHIGDMVKSGYDAMIKETSLKLSDLQATLHRFELREHTLKDIEREHKEAVEWQADLNLLVKAMSPTDGLIGKYLKGFMQDVVLLLNAIIEEVWTYPLEVLPSKVDRDELDYNFPLNVNSGAVSPPDISRGSSSQRDIVNFAFKLIFMKFLGLEDYPLPLDEFGNTFDEQHRQNLIPFLNRLIESGTVSQIIYISHFGSSHGAFNHAETVVLDPTNITVPQVYNKNVKIA